MGQFISFKSKINNPWFNPWFILLHTHSNVCATVEGRCLEYLVCITLMQSTIIEKTQNPRPIQYQCVNTVSRKCEYGVLEITSDTKVLLSHESQTSDLTKDFCFTRDFQNPILTFPHSQHWHCWKLQISDMKLQMKWDIFLKEMKFLSILVNVLTCDYIDFYKLAISQKNLWNWCWSKSMYSHVTTLTFTN